eukprot:jgi/Tetstr1/456725/TSEL_043422.t1
MAELRKLWYLLDSNGVHIRARYIRSAANLISKVRKGLAASQVEPDPHGVRTDVPARLITRTLRLAETLREELGPTWTRDQLPRILLFRDVMAVVAMHMFYARGKAGVACQTGYLTVTADARWAVTHDEPAASWTSATVTNWLQLVAHMLEEHPPPGFVWTSHSLRKGAATAAYAIGVVLQKIKHFTESHIYLVWNPATRRVVASRNVIFGEGWRDAASSSKGGSGGDAAASLEMFQALLDNGGVGSTSDASRLEEITEAHRRVVDETDDVEELEIEEAPQTAEELELGSQRPTLELTQLETNEGTHDGGQEESIVQRAERDPYPARSRRAPGQWWVVHPENPNDEAAAMMAAAFAAVTKGVDEPITLKQALSGAFEEQWTQAAESEFKSLEKQGTWVVCELPEERTAIPSKWVFEGGQLICILVVYVDDMIFAFKDALGVAVERDWDNVTLKVHQAKYIDDMLHKFNLAYAFAVSTPAEIGADIPGSNKPLAAEVPYHALVCSVLDAMVATAA